MKAKRKLTHRLVHDKESDRWKCKCGYTLGDGHAKLYARCRLAGTEAEEAYLENKISSAPAAKDRKHAKPKIPPKKAQRQAASRGAGVSPKALDLFSL